MNTRPKTAFVFAGGGSYGAVQVGMLRALCAHDVRPDLVAGSSVGAINGAFYAGMPSANGIERLEALWRGLRRHDVFPIALSGLFGALVNSNHLFKPSGLRRLLTAHLPYSQLEDSAIPVHVMATDLLTGSSVRLSAGPAVAAVLASCAIPAIYPPVQIDDRTLIDGAVACNHTADLLCLPARRAAPWNLRECVSRNGPFRHGATRSGDQAVCEARRDCHGATHMPARGTTVRFLKYWTDDRSGGAQHRMLARGQWALGWRGTANNK